MVGDKVKIWGIPQSPLTLEKSTWGKMKKLPFLGPTVGKSTNFASIYNNYFEATVHLPALFVASKTFVSGSWKDSTSKFYIASANLHLVVVTY